MKLELSFVDFDDQGEPHPIGSLDEEPTKREILHVLYVDGKWKGPLWKRNSKGNLEVIGARELTRISTYSFKINDPEFTTERLQAKQKESWLYLNAEGKKRPIPKIEIDGEAYLIKDIPKR